MSFNDFRCRFILAGCGERRRVNKKEVKMKENPDPMGPPGVEPGTSRLSGVRSNHLSYGPWLPGEDSNLRPAG